MHSFLLDKHGNHVNLRTSQTDYTSAPGLYVSILQALDKSLLPLVKNGKAIYHQSHKHQQTEVKKKKKSRE